MKVITFSRFFPAKHPRKGERTLFIESIIEGMLAMGTFDVTDESLVLCGMDGEYTKYDVFCKYHTIRTGNRWKVGDFFSPRVWSELPYRSKQIIIAPPIEIKKIWDIEMYGMTTLIDDEPVNSLTLHEVSKNDGLEYGDFDNWFNPLPFKGQILCWNENIQYV